jgi:hypothetical protein
MPKKRGKRKKKEELMKHDWSLELIEKGYCSVQSFSVNWYRNLLMPTELEPNQIILSISQKNSNQFPIFISGNPNPLTSSKSNLTQNHSPNLQSIIYQKDQNLNPFTY